MHAGSGEAMQEHEFFPFTFLYVLKRLNAEHIFKTNTPQAHFSILKTVANGQQLSQFPTLTEIRPR